MSPQSILAITDFSANTDAVLSRAAQLAVEHGATLKLMYATPGGESSCPDAAIRLSHHASQISLRHEISVQTASQTADRVEDLVKAARSADLVVTGATRERTLKAFLRGQPGERLLRAVRRPVLMVRKESGPTQSPYGRVLIAVDFSEASRNLVASASALGKSAKVELFHAISTVNEHKLRNAETSEKAISQYRHDCMHHSHDRLCYLTDSNSARRNRVASAIGHDNPALQAVIQQQHSGAELIVVGKRAAGAVSDFLFGSVSQRVLRHATTDVLVIPNGYRTGTRVASGRGFVQASPTTRRIRAGAPLSPG